MRGLGELREQGRMTWIEELRPAGGVWQGVNTRTGSVASAIWVNHPPRAGALVFITIDGKSVKNQVFGLEPDLYAEDGGEG